METKELILKYQSRIEYYHKEIAANYWPESVNIVMRTKIELLKEVINDLKQL